MSEYMIDEMTEYERTGFHIDNDGIADWAIRKIAEADAELERMSDWYKDQLQAAKARHDEKVAFFTGQLRAYFQSVPRKETKTSSKYALPSGELVLSKPKQDFAAENPDALLGWCQVNSPELVRIEMKPAWNEIKKRLAETEAGIVDTETGLVVDGVVTLDKPEEFKVRMKGDK